MAGAQLLRRVSLFEGVDDSAIQGLLDAGRISRFQQGAYVVRQGEYGDSLYVILKGEATVESLGADGRVTRITRLKTGDYFGELALLGRGERKASVKSRTDCEMLELRKVHFDRNLRKFKQVKKRLDEIYTKNAILSFIQNSRYFRQLIDDSKQLLVRSAKLETFTKDDVIAEEGTPAQSLFVVRSGFVRVSRRVAGEQSEEILAYLGPEDFFGDEESTKSVPYGATAVAVEPVECIVVPRSTVWSIYLKQPELFAEFRRYSTARSAQQSGLLSSQTAMGFVRDVLEAGLGQARSALIINMEACVRCGNCVQACDDLHGFSRIARRGKKMTHRTSLESKKHESLYFPTSCLQCATPECMVGCPTGAIARDVGGEVYIKDTCIGCGSCARNCDFGNIAMAKAEADDGWLLGMLKGKGDSKAADEQGETDKRKTDLVAVKCDVCFEREFAACVYNCPTEAIMRVDPRSYFDELKAITPKVLTQDGTPKTAKTTTKKRGARWVDGALQTTTLLGTLVGGYLLHGAIGASSWSGIGLYAGVFGVALILLLGLIGARKRLRTQRLGTLVSWARVHSVLGGLLIGVVFFHAGYHANSVLGSLLLTMIALATLLGVGGQIASAAIPRLLAATEDEAMLPEDVLPKIRDLLDANAELLDGLEERQRSAVEQQAKRLVQSGYSYVQRGIGPKRLTEALEKRAKKLPALPESEHALSLRIAENLAHSRILSVRQRFEMLLTSWLPLHLVTSAIAATLLVGHLMTVVLW